MIIWGKLLMGFQRWKYIYKFKVLSSVSSWGVGGVVIKHFGEDGFLIDYLGFQSMK